MTVNIDYFGTTRSIPETDEENWGAEGTNLHVDTVRAVGSVVDSTTSGLAWLISNIPVLVFSSTTNLALGAGATITQSRPIHIVSGSGAITLNGTTAITNGVRHGQVLGLMGDSGITTNTVSITDGSNVSLNGNITLGAGHFLLLWWDSVLADWRELFRNN
jgi:hypothetical protein